MYQWRRENNWMGSKARVDCDFCGKLLWTNKYRLKTYQHHFCSRECMGKWYSENRLGEKHPHWKGGDIINICEWCGRDYSARRARKDSTRFCSRQCAIAWRADKYNGEQHPNWKGGEVIKICEICDNKFEVRPYREETARFCSVECADIGHSYDMRGENHPRWQGGSINYRGGNWKFQRNKARRRDDYKCAICGVKENGRQHDVHHIIPFREFENPKEANKLSNLMTLCQDCHIQAERKELILAV